MGRSVSTKVKSVAPWDIASNPKEPDPANKSKHLVLVMWGLNQLNKVSRVRVSVGRKSEASGKVTFRPFHSPPIIFK